MTHLSGPALMLLGVTVLVLYDSSRSELTSEPSVHLQDSKDGTENVGRSEKPEKKAGRKKVRFNVRLQLPASKVSKLMNGQDDGQYQKLSEIITEDIQKMYADQPGEQKVYQLQFSSKNARNKKTEPGKENIKKSFKTKTKNDKKRKNKLLKNSLNTLRKQDDHDEGSTSNVDNMTPQLPKRRKNGRWRPQAGNAGSQRQQSRRKERKIVRTNTNVMTSLEMLNKTEAPSTKKETNPIGVPIATQVADVVKASDEKFNVQRLTSLFRKCLVPSTENPGDYIIGMDQYLDAYSELLNIFYFFGPIFKFAADDIKEKIDVLRSLRKNGTQFKNDNYSTLQSMFAYEYSPAGAVVKTEGIRENKYLLRALKFIGALVKHFRDPDTNRSMSAKAKEAYDMSLAQYHEWYVKAAVNLALLAFPSRDYALSLMDVPRNDDGAKQMDDLSSAVADVYDEMLKLYHKYSAPT